MEMLNVESMGNVRKFRITINDRTYLVEVDDLFASPITVKVNGQPYQVDIETATVEPISVSEPVPTVEPAGSQVATPAAATASTRPVNATAKEVTAPMPGHIVEIAVTAGDEVRVGQEICSLEAMKMKNAIRSHRDGIVASVVVSLGQAVAFGDVLVTFE